ncbi:hypothetical protein BH10CHL1_BH10CHL1_06250 [soil metagenome]
MKNYLQKQCLRQSLSGGLVFVALILLVWATTATQQLQAQAPQPTQEFAPTAPAATPTPSAIYLPLVLNETALRPYRLGLGITNGPLTRYPDIQTLEAGWYTDWGVALDPARPNGIEYIQMVRVHQKLACGEWHHSDRDACPYAKPLDYVFTPDVATIQAVAQANPGSLWAIGNEMDALDFDGCVEYDIDGRCLRTIQLGQDEMTPETYARAYHDLYAIIKKVDPKARVAIGGLIQATPSSIGWLTTAWNSYRKRYNSDMPVDVWNIHNFILTEDTGEVVTQMAADQSTTLKWDGGPTDDWVHINHKIFDQQIRAMRQWMKARGQQRKPLIISEYGVLYWQCVKKNSNGECIQDLNNEQVVQDFMVWTFNYFLNTKDCDLGYKDDECRLVQRWLWFSLDHVSTLPDGRLSYGANPHGSLYNSTTLEMRPTGLKFRQYAQDHFAELAQLPSQ